jgi:transposase
VRFARWRDTGVWDRVAHALAADANLERVFLIQPSSAPTSIPLVSKKTARQAIGRSRGGLTTKLHLAVDATGNPLRLILTKGQIVDIDCAHALIEDLCYGALIADKGYDAHALVSTIEVHGALAVISPHSNRLHPRSYDHQLYRYRNLIERFFSRIKHYRRIATRYDKLARSYLAFVQLACA